MNPGLIALAVAVVAILILVWASASAATPLTTALTDLANSAVGGLKGHRRRPHRVDRQPIWRHVERRVEQRARVYIDRRLLRLPLWLLWPPRKVWPKTCLMATASTPGAARDFSYPIYPGMYSYGGWPTPGYGNYYRHYAPFYRPYRPYNLPQAGWW